MEKLIQLNILDGGSKSREEDKIMKREKKTKKDLSRRDFIKGTAMGAGTMALAALGTRGAKAFPVTELPSRWDYEVDMLIIGAGGAGLMAAIEAHDQGAKVLIVEMQETPYFSESSNCGGCAGIPRNDLQIAEGILDDSPDLLFEDMMRVGRYSNREANLRVYTDNVTEAYKRWTAHGAKPISHRYVGGHSRKRVLGYINRQVTDALYGQVKARRIPILFNTRAKCLVVDPQTWRVLGVEARKGVVPPYFEYEAGQKIFVRGNVTVLCTGGMCGSPEMLDRYSPRVGKFALAGPWIIRGVPEGFPERAIGLGDGYIMGMEIGADHTHMYSITTYTGVPHPDKPGYRAPIAVSIPGYTAGAIAVNKEGKRFIEEATSAPCDVGEGMLLQTGKTLFKVCDKTMYDKVTQSPEALSLLAQGKAYTWFGDTIEDVAGKAKVDPAGLRDTLQKWNSYVAQGNDADFGRPPEYMAKIETPPFIIQQNWLAPIHNSGGLVSNTRLQILDVNRKVIPGLYGAGEVVGGDSGEVYLTCTHWPCAMTLGYLVGKYFAIKEALGLE
ncbi:MAG: FAD-binding protein [Acidobacteria bacterium]|nr:FAD-binding protein [Acidobacteriota bacterium]